MKLQRFFSITLIYPKILTDPTHRVLAQIGTGSPSGLISYGNRSPTGAGLLRERVSDPRVNRKSRKLKL
jgi:hypothetical protein